MVLEDISKKVGWNLEVYAYNVAGASVEEGVSNIADRILPDSLKKGDYEDLGSAILVFAVKYFMDIEPGSLIDEVLYGVAIESASNFLGKKVNLTDWFPGK